MYHKVTFINGVLIVANFNDFLLFANIKFRIVSPDRPFTNAKIVIDKTANIKTR